MHITRSFNICDSCIHNKLPTKGWRSSLYYHHTYGEPICDIRSIPTKKDNKEYCSNYEPNKTKKK